MCKYQAYSEYKDSEVEWIGHIPVHWKTASLSKLFNIRAGGDVKTRFFSEEKSDTHPFPIYTNANNEKSIYGYTSKSYFPADTITVSGRGEVGFAAYRDHAYDSIIRLLVLIPMNKCSGKFFTYFVNEVIVFKVESSAIGQLSTQQISPYKVAFPSNEEQVFIVNYLDHETAKIDTLIDKQQQLIQLLKEKRQAVISHAVTKGLNPSAPMRDSGVEWLGEVPEHWEKSKIKFIAELTPRKIEIAAYKDSTCSFIPMEKLKKDLLILDEIRNISEVFDGYTYFRNEDLLVAKVTPCFENKNMVVARGLLNGIGFGSSEIYVLRAQINNLNDFLYYRLQEDVFMEMATSEMTGAGGLRRVPSEFLSNFQLALPPEKERLEIVNFIKDYVSKFDMLMRLAEEAINLMQERRTALISAAVTGKIDVRSFNLAHEAKDASA